MTMMATDTTVMHHAVLLDPFDEVARLAYADTLEEEGRLIEANLVRLRVQWGKDNKVVSTHWNTISGPGDALCPGLIDFVNLTYDDFMTRADVLFRTYPITGVILTDKAPYARTPSRMNWAWWSYAGARPFRNTLPGDLFALLPYQQKKQPPVTLDSVFYPTEAAALEDLSHACVTYGRRLAGLPPLPTE